LHAQAAQEGGSHGTASKGNSADLFAPSISFSSGAAQWIRPLRAPTSVLVTNPQHSEIHAVIRCPNASIREMLNFQSDIPFIAKNIADTEMATELEVGGKFPVIIVIISR
jgi:hypothetical protein